MFHAYFGIYEEKYFNLASRSFFCDAHTLILILLLNLKNRVKMSKILIKLYRDNMFVFHFVTFLGKIKKSLSLLNSFGTIVTNIIYTFLSCIPLFE